jgi:hypothetical protein
MKYLLFYIFFNVAHASEMNLTKTNEYTNNFDNRASFQLGVNPSPTQITTINNLNFSYATKQNSYWLDFNFQVSSGLFRKMTQNNALATGLLDTNLINDRSTHSSLGFGAMLESQYSKTFFSVNDLYETSTAYLTYNIFKTNSVTNTFTGPGLMTKFSLCKKYSDLFSFGANLNYLFASVKRSSINVNETSSAQSLTLSYLTLGRDLVFTL